MSKTIIRLLLALPALIAPFTAAAQQPERQIPQSQEQVQLSFAPVVKQVSPAVVNIYTKRIVERAVNPFANDPFFSRFFGGNNAFGNRIQREAESSLGSGVILDPEGLIVTNAHVIKGAQEITVILNDGRELDATLALSDQASDLALLRVKSNEALPYASLKPSESLEVGDLVLAIGNPFGVGQTVTSGIVSAQGRSSLNINDFNFFIQTDAAINPGNSGGPLVTLDGGVVGINSAIYSRDGGSLGIGFAVPSEMVATIIAAEKSGRMGEDGVVRPWLGVTAQGVSSDIGESLDLKTPKGALITKLHEASPLKAAGMKVGDVITSVNNWEIRDPSEMKFRMATVPLGQKTQMLVLRQGKTLTFLVEAMAPPEIPPSNETKLTGAHILNGATIANLNPALALRLSTLDIESGVVVVDAPRGTQSARVVLPGDVLLKINGKDIQNVEDAKSALAGQGSGVLVVNSQGRIKQIVVR